MKQTTLDKNLPMPLYFQLKEDLRQRITTREWKPGKKIPTEAELCEMYDVSRITARKALEELQLEGYLDKQQGKGTFVRSNTIEQKLSKFYSFSEELKSRGLHEDISVVDFERLAAEEEIADGLGITAGEPVFCVSRIRSVNGDAYAYEKSYIPAALAAGLSQQMVENGGLYRSLASLGIIVDSAKETIRAINLDDETAQMLDVPAHDAAIHLIRTAYFGPQTVEYCISIVVGHFFSYTVELK